MQPFLIATKVMSVYRKALAFTADRRGTSALIGARTVDQLAAFTPPADARACLVDVATREWVGLYQVDN